MAAGAKKVDLPLVRLAILHVRMVRGERTIDSHFDSVPELRNWLLDEWGWRPDAMHRVRKILTAALAIYVDKASALRSHASTPETQASIVAALWGITEFPRSPTELGWRLQAAAEPAGIIDLESRGGCAATPAVSESRYRNRAREWEKKIAGHHEVVKWYDEWLAENKTELTTWFAAPPTKAPSIWRLKDVASWPPIDPIGNTGITERAALLALAGAQLSGMKTDEETVVGALRELVDTRVIHYLRDPQNDELLRGYRANVQYWFEQDPIALLSAAPAELHRTPILSDLESAAIQVPSDIDDEDLGTKARRSLSVIVKLFFYEVVEDRNHVRTAVRARAARTSIDEIARAMGRPPLISGTVDQVLARRANEDERWRERNAEDYEGLGFRADLDSNVPQGTQLIELAQLARLSSGDIQVLRCQQYLRLRERHNPAIPMVSEQLLLVTFADVSVQLDLQRLRLAAEVRRLSSIMAKLATVQPDVQRFQQLARRNEALVHVDNDDFVSAVSVIATAYYSLRPTRSVESLPRSSLEVLHQLALSGASIYTRALEKLFLNAESNSSVVRSAEPSFLATQLARTALWFSEEVVELLGYLEREGFQKKRYENRSMATRDWLVQTPIMRLRTLLAVRTAVESSVASHFERSEIAVDGLTPDLESIHEQYRMLLGIDELKPSHLPDIARMALWVAMLSDGKIPLAPNLGKSIAPLVGFLDGLPYDLAVRLNTRGCSNWLRAQNSDAGIVGRVSVTSNVGRYLSDSSDGAFEIWRAEFDRADAVRPGAARSSAPHIQQFSGFNRDSRDVTSSTGN